MNDEPSGVDAKVFGVPKERQQHLRNPSASRRRVDVPEAPTVQETSRLFCGTGELFRSGFANYTRELGERLSLHRDVGKCRRTDSVCQSLFQELPTRGCHAAPSVSTPDSLVMDFVIATNIVCHGYVSLQGSLNVWVTITQVHE